MKRNMLVTDALVDEDTTDTTNPELCGYTNVITTNNKSKIPSQLKRDSDYALQTKQQNLIVKQNNDIWNVLDLYCLNRGYMQRRIQLFLVGDNFKVIPVECIPC